MTHICVTKLTINGPENGMSPERRQAIIQTNVGKLSIGTLGTNFSDIVREIPNFPFEKMNLKTSSSKWRPFCLGLSQCVNSLISMYINHATYDIVLYIDCATRRRRYIGYDRDTCSLVLLRQLTQVSLNHHWNSITVKLNLIQLPR